MRQQFIYIPGKKPLVRLTQKWINVKMKEISPRHKLWGYATDKNTTTQKGDIYSFRWNNNEFCIEQFISKRSPFSSYCFGAPDFIAGYAPIYGYAQPLLIELDATGQKVRIYMYYQHD